MREQKSLSDILYNKYRDKLHSEQQKKLFIDCAKVLERHYKHACERQHNKKIAYFINIDEIDEKNFYDKYQYWLYDTFSGLFFVNIHSKHSDFRRCLVVLHLITEGWNGKEAIIEDLTLDLEMGFYETGGKSFGSNSRRILTPDNFNRFKYPFTKRFMVEEINYSKNEAKTDLTLLSKQFS